MEDIKQQIGQQIREARKSKGLTLKEMGVKLGVSESVVSNYESGKQNLTIATLHKIADALNMKFGTFFE